MAIQDSSATISSHKRNLENLVDEQDPRYVGTGPYESLEGSGSTLTLVPGPLLLDRSLMLSRCVVYSILHRILYFLPYRGEGSLLVVEVREKRMIILA